MGIFDKLFSTLAKTREGATGGLENRRVDDDFFEELTDRLIMADAGVETAQKITGELRARLREKHIKQTADAMEELVDITAKAMEPETPLKLDGKPSVLLFIGVNGSGKTTSAGKLAARFMREGKRVILAAADTFRAAAVEQLEIWGERSGAQVIKHQSGADPAAVVFDAVSAAVARGADIVICDTAGRLHNKKNLMDELSKISRTVSKVREDIVPVTLLVLDGTTGQNAIQQASVFADAAGVDGIVLTKLDGTAKGGAALAVKEILGIPVRYIGVGEKPDDIEQFDPRAYAAALFAVE